MSNTSTPKRGRGRPKGGTSLMNVSVAEITRVLNESATIPVSRVFAERIGLSGTTAAAAQVHRMANKPVVPAPTGEDIVPVESPAEAPADEKFEDGEDI